MSAHVLLNVTNELRKRDKMRGLLNCIFGVKMSRFSLILRNVIKDVIMFPKKL